MPKTRFFTQEAIASHIEQIISGKSTFFTNETEMLKFALNVLDLTTLEGSDNDSVIENLCRKAVSFSDSGLPNVAAVCVYPVFVNRAKTLLAGTNIHVASVAGAFPSGQSPIEIKTSEVAYAVNEGADEIDMVISRGKFLEGNNIEVFDEIRAIKEACKKAHLKVILETGELKDPDLIYNASMLSLKAGADFIKTSTGKIPVAATPEAAYVMLFAIKDYYEKTGFRAGFKPAGGISTPEQALVYIRLVEEILGEEWLTNKLFRIGASRLASNLANKLLQK